MVDVRAQSADASLSKGAITIVKPVDREIFIPQLGSSLILIAHDVSHRLGVIAHIVLPDSNLPAPPLIPGASAQDAYQPGPAHFADKAIPALLDVFKAQGGKEKTARYRMMGGAQLFNFGGGSGNPLNVGFRNAVAARAALSKQGLRVEKADVGGNKARQVRYLIGTGQIYVALVGGREYLV